MTRRKTEITATVLWSLATKGTQKFKNKSPHRSAEFPNSAEKKIGNLPLELVRLLPKGRKNSHR